MSRKHKKRQKHYSFSSQNQIQKPQNHDDFDLKFWRNILILLSLFVYLIIFPPFLKNQVLGGHDAGAHLAYLRIFTDALSQGQFPVRWIEWVIPGQNQPLFSYYQPLIYYLGQVPHLLGMNIMNSLYATVIFSWLFSGLMVFLFVKNVTKNILAGLAASCVYVFAPYHILDVFVRAAYPEVIALSFAPGMFWALERLFTTEKKVYIGFLGLFTAATFVSHPPTLLMFGIPLFFYFLFLIFGKLNIETPDLKQIVKKILYTSAGFVLAGGLASFFAVPALFQQGLTQASSLESGYFDFHNHFVCLTQLFWSNWGYGDSIPGCSDQLSFQVGIVNWFVILTVIGVLGFYFYKKINHPINKQAIFWLSMAFLGMYMTLSYSQPFWEGLPYIAFLQFPWRFLSIVIFSVSVLSGILFLYVKKETYKMLLFAALIIAAPLLTYSYLQPAAYLPGNYFGQDSKDFYQGTAKGAKDTSAVSGYFPKTMAVLPQTGTVPKGEIAISNPKATVSIIKSTFTDKEFSVSSTLPLQIELFIHYFPGWKFSSNNNPVNPNTSNIYDFVFLNVPAGSNIITAKYKNTPLITFSNYLSLISILILIFLIFIPEAYLALSGKLKKQQKTIPPNPIAEA